jgi:F-type H+-transporting ATPase subunit b
MRKSYLLPQGSNLASVSQLFFQLGIDWHLLLSQAVNFLLLLVILRIVAYKPLLNLLHRRREKIEEGLVKAEEADKRLGEVEQIGKEKIKEAENLAIRILKKTENDARDLEAALIAEVKRKEAEELKNAGFALRAQEEASRRAMEQEAATLVRAAIVKTVGLSPDAINEALIAKAVKEARQSQ